VIRPLFLAMTLLAAALPSAAQSIVTPAAASAGSESSAIQGAQPADAGRRVQFLPRALFHMSGEHLSGDDEQFVWEANLGGELDFLDWGLGRATFAANYQVMLGEEFKAFDPNQGNYMLDAAGSARLGGVEVSGVFHHVSRHRSDRAIPRAVDWNMVGGRLQGKGALGVMFIDAQAQFLGVIQKSYVDYEWELDGRVRNDIVLRPGIGVLFGGNLRLVGVDGSRSRGTQIGARAEGGVRFDGQMGAVELFVAVERRIDPVTLEFGTMSWLAAGFRFLNR